MFMPNFGLTNKEHYGVLWYYLEWLILVCFDFVRTKSHHSMPFWRIFVEIEFNEFELLILCQRTFCPDLWVSWRDKLSLMLEINLKVFSPQAWDSRIMQAGKVQTCTYLLEPSQSNNNLCEPRVKIKTQKISEPKINPQNVLFDVMCEMLKQWQLRICSCLACIYIELWMHAGKLPKCIHNLIYAQLKAWANSFIT